MSEAFARFEYGEGESDYVELTRENTTLFMHLGHLSVYDHLFIEVDENNVAYYWRHLPQFDEMVQAAVEHDVMAHLNIPAVNSNDERVYMKQAMKDLGDYVPEEWL